MLLPACCRLHICKPEAIIIVPLHRLQCSLSEAVSGKYSLALYRTQVGLIISIIGRRKLGREELSLVEGRGRELKATT